MHMPEAGKVLCLKIFGAVLYCKFYSVIFAEAFVPVILLLLEPVKRYQKSNKR